VATDEKYLIFRCFQPVLTPILSAIESELNAGQSPDPETLAAVGGGSAKGETFYTSSEEEDSEDSSGSSENDEEGQSSDDSDTDTEKTTKVVATAKQSADRAQLAPPLSVPPFFKHPQHSH